MKPRIVQAYRLAILAGIAWLVHAQHGWISTQRDAALIDIQGGISDSIIVRVGRASAWIGGIRCRA